MGTAKQKGSQEKNGGADALLSACTQNSDESELFVGRFVFRSHFYRFWKIHSLDHVQCKWWRLRRTYTLDRCINRQQTQRSSDEASHFYLFANRAKQRRMEDHFLYLVFTHFEPNSTNNNNNSVYSRICCDFYETTSAQHRTEQTKQTIKMSASSWLFAVPNEKTKIEKQKWVEK